MILIFFKKKIQLIYYGATEHDELVPLLNFIILIAIMVFNIFWRINHIIIRIYRMRGKKPSDNEKKEKKRRKITVRRNGVKPTEGIIIEAKNIGD